MELSRTISLLARVSRFLTLTLAAGMALRPAPALPSQTAKELIADTCYNELQQREKRTLWSYVAKRSSNNHVFREQVIETVDASVRHLLAVDGEPPTSVQMKEENDRNRELLKNVSRRHAIQKQQDNDDKKMEELLRIIPEAFVFEDQGQEGESERIAFHPIGHVEQGGTTDITRVHLSPGIWKTSAEKIDINGQFVILKTINKHQNESRTGFEPIAPDTTFAQALNKIENK